MTTLVMAPLILLPVSLGVMLQEHRLWAWAALLLCLGLFALAQIAAIEVSHRLRKPSDAHPARSALTATQLDFWESILLPARIHSPLCGIFIEDGMAVDVQIFRYVRQDRWFMEITEGESAPWRWKASFQTDKEAWQDFLNAVRRDTLPALAKTRSV